MHGGAAAEGWYPDPEGTGLARYWDGRQWTDRRGEPSRIGTGAPGMSPCHVCWRTPTAAIEVHRHTGYVILGSFRTTKGFFCRHCGLCIARDATAHSLAWGWSIFGLAWNPFLLLINLRSLRDLERLAEPTGPAAAQPLDPGLPISQRRSGRVGIAVSLTLALLLVGLIVYGLVG